MLELLDIGFIGCRWRRIYYFRYIFMTIYS